MKWLGVCSCPVNPDVIWLNYTTGEPLDDIERHIVGATVTHVSPFAAIEVPELTEPLTREFREKWVVPFYRASLFGGADDFADALYPVADEITPTLLTSLLSDFNWRPRISAAYFAAILIESSVEDHIGNLLLRSDVCFAGNGYCLALARFNTPKSVEYLSRYLTYYLSKPNLHFNQGEAFGALAYLDRANGTSHLDAFAEQWDTFVAGGETWEREEAVNYFNTQLASIVAIAATIAG